MSVALALAALLGLSGLVGLVPVALLRLEANTPDTRFSLAVRSWGLKMDQVCIAFSRAMAPAVALTHERLQALAREFAKTRMF